MRDAGASYRFVPLPPELREASGSVYCTGNDVFVVREGVILRLTGDAWTALSPRFLTIESRFIGLVTFGSKIYVGTGARVLASSDGGATFKPALTGVSALATDGTTLFAAKDAGVHAVGPNDELTLIARAPKPVIALGVAAGALLAASEQRTYRSEDGGKSWKAGGGRAVGDPGVSVQRGDAGRARARRGRTRDRRRASGR